MNTNLSCDENTRRSNAERYVGGRMTALEAEAFEDHYVACAACQNEVRFVSSIVSGLAGAPVAALSAKKPRRAWVWGGSSLAIAAGLMMIMVLRSAPPKEIAALGGVGEPPTYLGIPVRTAGAGTDSLFDAAMDSYSKRQYAAAASGLRAALAAGKDLVPARFFLATSLLLDNRAAEASDEFARVLSYGATPYRAEARYYRAKALLRVGRAADAEVELSRLMPADGVIYDMGRALADSVARARGR